MKKKLIVATALVYMLATGAASAQTGHEMMHGAGPDAMPPLGTEMGTDPGMMGGSPGMRPCIMGGGMDMGPYMMGGSMGMGPHMMGGGMGMGPHMMGGGMGMGPGMMGGGMGMGPCMMGGSMGMGPCMMGTIDPEDQQKYLDATRDLRKKLNDKQFEYAEAARNPKTSRADLLKKRKELWDLQQKIHEKAWGFIKE